MDRSTLLTEVSTPAARWTPLPPFKQYHFFASPEAAPPRPSAGQSSVKYQNCCGGRTTVSHTREIVPDEMVYHRTLVGAKLTSERRPLDA
jgi:hypothetical protein